MGSRIFYYPGLLLVLFSFTTCGGGSSSSSSGTGSGASITSTVAVPTASSASVSSFLTKYASATSDVAPSECTDIVAATDDGTTLDATYDGGTLTIDAGDLTGTVNVFVECTCDDVELLNYGEVDLSAGTATLETTDIDATTATSAIFDAMGDAFKGLGFAMSFGSIVPEEVYAYQRAMWEGAEDTDDLGGSIFDMREMMRAYAAEGGKCDYKCMKDYMDGVVPSDWSGKVDGVLGSGFGAKISTVASSFQTLNDAMFNNCMGKFGSESGFKPGDLGDMVKTFMNYSHDEFKSTFSTGTTKFFDVFNIINAADSAATKAEGYIDNLASIFMGDSFDWEDIHAGGDYTEVFQMANTDSIACSTQEECESKFEDMYETFVENPTLFQGAGGTFDPTKIDNVAATIDYKHETATAGTNTDSLFDPSKFTPTQFDSTTSGTCAACPPIGTTTTGTTTTGTTTGGTTTGTGTITGTGTTTGTGTITGTGTTTGTGTAMPTPK